MSQIKNYSRKPVGRGVLCALFGLVLALPFFADETAYNAVVDKRVENENLVVVHHHDWSTATEGKRMKMVRSHGLMFTEDNDYARIECFEKASGRRLFKAPAPALTHLHISADSRYIVGLSNVMFSNPFQLVLFDRSGKLICKKHISAAEARLTKAEYREFSKKFPEQHDLLKTMDRIAVQADVVFIDPHGMNGPRRLKEAWGFLLERSVPSHFSPNFMESVTNHISWYKHPDPEIRIDYENQKVSAISLLDPKGQRFRIPIN